MPIELIDRELCTGCGVCVEESCPMDVIRLDEESGKAFIKYKKHCIACYGCTLDCPVEAINVTPSQGTPASLPW